MSIEEENKLLLSSIFQIAQLSAIHFHNKNYYNAEHYEKHMEWVREQLHQLGIHTIPIGSAHGVKVDLDKYLEYKEIYEG